LQNCGILHPSDGTRRCAGCRPDANLHLQPKPADLHAVEGIAEMHSTFSAQFYAFQVCRSPQICAEDLEICVEKVSQMRGPTG